MGSTIGILAGGGQFPRLIARAARADGMRVVVAGFAGNVDPALAHEVDAFEMFRLGQLSAPLAFLKRQDVARVVLAGAINKPKVMDLRPDTRTVLLLPRLLGKGDTNLMNAAIGELEKEGIAVMPAHLLVPSLLMPEGVLTRTRPTDEQSRDIDYGMAVAHTTGALDIGQTLVVKKEVVAAVEALEGTDACIRRGGQLAGPGAVVVKRCKPGQDERVDLPSVGLATIEVAAEAGIGCIAVEAGRALLFDRERAVQAANAAGIVLVGVQPGD